MAHRFFYLRGALGQKELLEQHQATIKQILTGDYTEKNIETLQGVSKIYSFRINLVERLLFTTINQDDTEFLLVLEYLPTHDYKRAKFLQSPLFLERYKSKIQTSSFPDGAQDLSLVWIPLEPEAALELKEKLGQPSDKVAPKGLDYYQSEWVFLNTEQEEIFKLKLPGMVSGVAGSGKSLVGMSLLSEGQSRQPQIPMLYITSSKALARAREADWLKLPISNESNVFFKTYDEVFFEAMPTLETQAQISPFETWYKQYVRVKTTISAKHSFNPLDSKIVYEEFRIASGYTKEEYECLGESLCLVEKSRRSEVYDALTGYLRYLDKNHLYDASFSRLPADARRYGMIVVDEAQDLSYGQLMQIADLADQHRILFCFDGHQRLNDRRSLISFIKSKFNLKEDNHLQLSESYRCTSSISLFANQLLSFKHHVLGDKLNKHDPSQILSKIDEQQFSGDIHLVSPEEFIKCPWSRHLGESTKIVAVTSLPYKQELMHLFGFSEEQVFTPHEIKGLESEEVLVWKLCDEAIFKGIAQARIEPEDCVTHLHALYTAFTRAKTRLILCENERYTLTTFRQLYQHFSVLPLDRDDLISKQADWLAHVDFLCDHGFIQRAEAIYTKKCALALSFEEYRTSKIKPSSREMLVCANVSRSEHPPVLGSASQPPLSEKTEGADSDLEHYVTSLAQSLDGKTFKDALMCCDINALLHLPILKKARGGQSLLDVIKSSQRLTQQFFKTIASDDDLLQSQPLRKALMRSGNFSTYKYYSTKKKIYESLHDKLVYTTPSLTQWLEIVDECFELGVTVSLANNLNFNEAFIRAVEDDKTFKDVKRLIEQSKIDGRLFIPIIDDLVEKALAYKKFRFIKKLDELHFHLHFALFKGLRNHYLKFNCQKKYLACLMGLRDAGIDLTKICSCNGALPHIAAELNQYSILAYLHSWGFDLNLSINNEQRPVMIAAEKGALLSLIEFERLGVDLHQIDRLGYNLAHVAVEYERYELLQYLRRIKLNFNHYNRKGLSPLGLAVSLGHISVLRYLHKIGLDLNLLQTRYLLSLVHLAVICTQPDILMLLCGLNFDLNAKDIHGHRPIDWAAHLKSEIMIEHLRYLGANMDDIKPIEIEKSSQFGFFSNHVKKEATKQCQDKTLNMLMCENDVFDAHEHHEQASCPQTPK